MRSRHHQRYSQLMPAPNHHQPCQAPRNSCPAPPRKIIVRTRKPATIGHTRAPHLRRHDPPAPATGARRDVPSHHLDHPENPPIPRPAPHRKIIVCARKSATFGHTLRTDPRRATNRRLHDLAAAPCLPSPAAKMFRHMRESATIGHTSHAAPCPTCPLILGIQPTARGYPGIHAALPCPARERAGFAPTHKIIVHIENRPHSATQRRDSSPPAAPKARSRASPAVGWRPRMYLARPPVTPLSTKASACQRSLSTVQCTGGIVAGVTHTTTDNAASLPSRPAPPLPRI